MKPKEIQLPNGVQPYETIRELTSNLYCLDGEWFNTPFRRRMTVIRLSSGELIIHSAIQLIESDYVSLEKIGRVCWIVVPNSFHDSEAAIYKHRYPKAKLLVSRLAVKSVEKQCKVDGVLPDAWPSELKNEVDCLELTGTRLMGECVFFHRSSKTLVLTDLVFNMQNEGGMAEKLFFKLNKIYRRFGPSRLFQYLFVSNKTEAVKSLRKIMEWDFDRIIMNHGTVLESGGSVESGGKEKMRASFLEMGLKI